MLEESQQPDCAMSCDCSPRAVKKVRGHADVTKKVYKLQIYYILPWQQYCGENRVPSCNISLYISRAVVQYIDITMAGYTTQLHLHSYH